MSTSAARTLSVPRATALYIGALFGPGLLLLPGLAAQQAGPASIIAWVALLGLSGIFAAVFAALGRAMPNAAGAAGYAAAGLGPRAAAMTRWWFLAGVVAGAPIVCLIGASYVTALTGGGPVLRAAVAAGLLLAVLGLAVGGVRASTMAQLLLVALSVGRAAATLMLSFVGWEAVAPLTGRLRAGQLSRVIGVAFTVTAVLYLGLAVATVSVLGRGSDLSVPLADLLQVAIGPAGRAVAAVAALVLTVGAVNAYVSGATEMLRELTAVPSQKGPNGPGRPPRFSARALLGVVALAGLVLIGLSALRLADITALVSVPTAMFLGVYLTCTAAAARILTGPVRVAAAVAALAVLAVLAFCGWTALLAVVAVAAIAASRPTALRWQQGRARVEDRHRWGQRIGTVRRAAAGPGGSRRHSPRTGPARARAGRGEGRCGGVPSLGSADRAAAPDHGAVPRAADRAAARCVSGAAGRGGGRGAAADADAGHPGRHRVPAWG
jgi:amino acid efflux transporter